MLINKIKDKIYEIDYRIRDYAGSIRWKMEVEKYSKKYDTYNETTFLGDSELLWSDNGTILNYMVWNDFEVWYDHKKKEYSMSYETMFGMDNQQQWCNLLKEYLECFGEFMDKNSYDKNTRLHLAFCILGSIKSDSIEELYKIFECQVKGFCAVYENNEI